jgi:hypothetical protein
MKRYLAIIFLSGIVPAVVLNSAQNGTNAPKLKPPCAASLTDCPNQGCGTDFDPKLNLRKNITSEEQLATDHTLTWMKTLANPDSFKQGQDRADLIDLGEGQNIRVVAYLLAIRKELSGESCNCYLHLESETDNHLVLVTGATVDRIPAGNTKALNSKSLAARELESETAEFTPRVRLNHPNFTYEKVQPLVDATAEKALLVRVTGPLLFDSEHFIHFPLKRVNNWEIHPIFKLEICTSGDACTARSDAGWKSLDDLH